jgi:periplasmic divalent cation tolerance protein
MDNPTDKIIVISNLPDQGSATRLAEILISRGQAACVNVLAPCTSIYHWQDKTESTQEVPVLIKTTQEKYAEVERTIRMHHPYELPEIVYVPIAGGLPSYLDWISKETSR